MKQTTEFFGAGFATVNGYAEAKKDGKIDGNDIQFALPLIFKWQEAVKDLTFATEASNATPASIDKMFDDVHGELSSSNMTGDFKYAFTNSVKGYYCTYWGISNTSFQAGKLAALAEVKKRGAAAVLAEAGL